MLLPIPGRVGTKAFEDEVRRAGFSSVDTISIVLTHLSEVIRNNLSQLLSYKDVRILSPFLPERGKIQPRRISGTCAKHQRKLQTAIKRARQLALIPYVTD